MARVRYSPELVEAVCEKLREGISLRAIGKMEGMPSRETLRLWCQEHPQHLADIACARDLGFDDTADRLVEEVRAATDIAKAKLVFDAERWRLAKLNPERYGERQLVQSEISGPKGAPITLDDDAAAARLAAIIANVQARAAKAHGALTDQRDGVDDLA